MHIKTRVLPLALGLLISAPRLVSADKAPLLAPLSAPTQFVVPGGQSRFDFIEMDEANNRLLLTHSSKKSLAVFDATSGALLKEITTGGANGVTVDAKDNKYFVGAGDANLVAVIDSVTLTKIKDIPTTGPVDGMAFDTQRGLVYADHDDGPDVWVIDAKTEKIVSTITIPEAPEYVEYNPTTDRIYQNIKSNSTIQVINPATNAIETHWDTLPAKNPHGLAIDFATNHLFTSGANGKLAEIDIATGKVIAQVDIASRVDQIAFDAGTTRIYCASGSGVLSVIEETADGLKSLGEVKTSQGCHSVTVDPKTHAVWVAYGTKENSYIVRFMPMTN